MSDAELLTAVKKGLGITGTYQDDTLTIYINDVKLFLTDAGVDAETVMSAAAVGVIVRGVADLWNYGSGKGELSPYFMQRATQLSYVAEVEEAEGNE